MWTTIEEHDVRAPFEEARKRMTGLVDRAASLVKVDCHGLTDRGLTRERNEDQFFIADLTKSMLVEQTSLSQADLAWRFGNSQGKLLVVADGMGGHGGGSLASSVAVDAVADYVLNILPWFFGLEDHDDDLQNELKLAMERCQARVRAAARSDPAHPTMGTTLTMAYVLWPKLYVVHVGDSRCYLLRSGKLQQITRDHTVAQQYVEAGTLTPEEAQRSRWSSVLWNAVGGGSTELEPEVHKARLNDGDCLLLCTDGLTRHLTSDDIVRILTAHPTSSEATENLVRSANSAGGSDNVTVVVARFHKESGAVQGDRLSRAGTTGAASEVTQRTRPG